MVSPTAVTAHMCGPAEGIATWYFRLNGFLTTTNFILHPDIGTVQLTDVDIVGIRLPWRHETAGQQLIDDEWLTSLGEEASIVIAEVKKGRCNLNGPTRDPDRQILQRVLRSLGAFQQESVGAVAAALYSRGRCSNGIYCVWLCCLGSEQDAGLSREFAECRQITWANIAAFIHRRFTSHMDQKKQHQQWDDLGQWLWNWVTTSTLADFERKLISIL